MQELAYWRSRRDTTGCLPHLIALVLFALAFLVTSSPWNALALLAGLVAFILGIIAAANQSDAVAKVKQLETTIDRIESGK